MSAAGKVVSLPMRDGNIKWWTKILLLAGVVSLPMRDGNYKRRFSKRRGY